ncbi:MAG: hypothetical protein ABUS79_03335, partial [Pseudomonadota bacterium]
MRLSATDQIIRDAEEHDAQEPGDALPDVDIDVAGIDDDLDEGETQVDIQRSAAALQELRSFGAPSPRRPVSRETGVASRQDSPAPIGSVTSVSSSSIR